MRWSREQRLFSWEARRIRETAVPFRLQQSWNNVVNGCQWDRSICILHHFTSFNIILLSTFKKPEYPARQVLFAWRAKWKQIESASTVCWAPCSLTGEAGPVLHAYCELTMIRYCLFTEPFCSHIILAVVFLRKTGCTCFGCPCKASTRRRPHHRINSNQFLF